MGSGARELKLEPAARRDGLALAVARPRGRHGRRGLVVRRRARRTRRRARAAQRRRGRAPPGCRRCSSCSPGGWCATRPTRRPAGGFVVGWLAIAFGVLGIVSIAHGVPDSTEGAAAMRRAGGDIGYLSSSPLSSGLTDYVAAPLLGAARHLRHLRPDRAPRSRSLPSRLLQLRDQLLRRHAGTSRREDEPRDRPARQRRRRPSARRSAFAQPGGRLLRPTRPTTSPSDKSPGLAAAARRDDADDASDAAPAAEAPKPARPGARPEEGRAAAASGVRRLQAPAAGAAARRQPRPRRVPRPTTPSSPR